MPNHSQLQSQSNGLTNEEAAARLARNGFNELARPARRTPFRIIGEVIREPMLALLIGGGVVYLLLGDVTEAAILLAFACLSVLITVVQEAKTERVLEALRDLTSPRALVIRDGAHKRIAGRDVVCGDVLVLAEGDRVPADVRLIEATDLQADESLLTGESVPVRKAPGRDLPDVPMRPGGDDLPLAYSGTLIVRGAGIGEVIATGAMSEIGKIGKSLSTLETEAPHLQTQTRKLVTVFAIVGAAVSLLVVVLYGTMRGGWLDAVLAGIAVGMSMLPEEFPVVLTVFMAMGAWRISQARVLTRRTTAIEALGSATVLCTDKTGTLTENRMTIAQLRLATGASIAVEAATKALPEAFQDLVACGVLASAVEPFDPMEKAFQELAKRTRENIAGTIHTGWRLVKAYALRADLLAMSHVWKPADDGNSLVVASKGAPEAIAELCQMTPSDRAALKLQIDEMATAGLRVLGVAKASFTGNDMPATQAAFAFEFVGLVGLADPLRPSVPAAVQDCRTAGIRVIMITGDYPATARAVARLAGITGDDLMTGDELAAMSDTDLAVRAQTTTVFARIMSEQKLRIVEALKASGEVVAMTGDGVE